MPSSALTNPFVSPESAPRFAWDGAAVRPASGLPHEPPPRPIDTHDALRPGSAVGSFVLRALVEKGDFSLLYLAGASASDAEVLIEEFWPAALVERGPDGAALLRDPALAELFEAGLQAFVDEAAELAQLDHAALAKFGPVWKLRGTACRLRVEPIGRGLAGAIATRARPPDERWLRALADALLGALDTVHRAGRIHANVRPGNVVLRDDDSPVLLDFGAAAAAMTRRAAWRSPQPEPAFPAPEWQLYGSVPGPSADVYSLAALLWFCSTGEPPDMPGAAGPAESRWDAVLRRKPALNFSTAWREAIDAGLAFDAGTRPQSVEAFRRLLVERAPVTSAPAAAPTASTLADAPSWDDPSWSGLDIDPPMPTGAATRDAPGRGGMEDLRSVAEPFGAMPPFRAEVGREPTWHLETSAPAPPRAGRERAPVEPVLRPVGRADDVDWPTSGPALLDGPLERVAADAWPSPYRPVAAKRARHWPWAVGGALAGVALLVFGLGFGPDTSRLEPPLARLVSLARDAVTGDPVTGVARNASTGMQAPAGPNDAAPIGPNDAAPSPAAPTQAPAEASGRGAVRGAVPPPTSRGTDARGAAPAGGIGSSVVTPAQPASPRMAARADADAERKAGTTRTGPSAAEADPASACAPRTNFSLYLCMKTQCERSAWYAHPQCVALRREDQR